MKSKMSTEPSFRGDFFATIVKSADKSSNGENILDYIQSATNEVTDKMIIGLIDKITKGKSCTNLKLPKSKSKQLYEELEGLTNKEFKAPDGNVLLSSNSIIAGGHETRVISILATEPKKGNYKEGEITSISYVTGQV